MRRYLGITAPAREFDLALALVCGGLAIGVLIVSHGYPHSAAALPEIIGYLLLACAVALGFFPGKRADFGAVRGARLAMTLALAITAITLIEWVGADVGLWVLFVGCACVMGYPLGGRLMVMALVMVALIGTVFGGLLGVALPGPVFGSLFA